MDEGPGEEDADAARADAGSMARVQSLHAASAQQHVGQQLREYGRCTSSNAPRTECQSWKNCDSKRHIARQNKENIENLVPFLIEVASFSVKKRI